MTFLLFEFNKVPSRICNPKQLPNLILANWFELSTALPVLFAKLTMTKSLMESTLAQS